MLVKEEPIISKCLTPIQQDEYNKLPPKMKKYVEYRINGYPKKQAIILAGYSTKSPNQTAGLMERRHPAVREIVDTLLKIKMATDFSNEDGELNRTIDTLAMQKDASNVVETVNDLTPENAKRIQFYRDIANGKIKTVKKTIHKNAEGEVVKTVIEETSPLQVRISARKELDVLLGLNSIISLDSISTGDITINIVDASRKETKPNDVPQPSDLETIDGEEVIVAEAEFIEDKPKAKVINGKKANKSIEDLYIDDSEVLGVE